MSVDKHFSNSQPITEEEAKKLFSQHLETLHFQWGAGVPEDSVCAYSKCIDGKILVMKADAAGNCTKYSFVGC
ncbi:hypothetical protein [Methylobacterium mesophilicum]|uniref:hypothetical protein n=1 Tax=Methylobacterium mesophilicum TaxID=39956 RepID=UPI00360809B0